MRDEQWFNDNNRKAIYRKYKDYYHLFEALLNYDGHATLSYKLKDISFSAYELELILMLRQTFSVDNTENSYLIDGFNQLAERFKQLDHDTVGSDYLFIQAYISFIHDQIAVRFDGIKFDVRTQENLIGFARFSVDIADSYASRSTEYCDVRSPRDALEEYIEERNKNLYGLLYSLGSLSLKTKEKLIDEIVSTIKKEYLQQPPLDDDGFANLYEYLGYIAYHGSDHMLYQTAFEELDNTIHCKVSHLSLPDMVKLFEDGIDNIVDNGDMKDIDEWSDYSKVIVESSEFDRLLREIRGEFMRGVPEYFPE